MNKAWKFGRDVNTDVIIPARYLSTFDPKELAAHLMEDTDNSDFKSALARGEVGGDIIVTEENFGCGSSREHAPIAIKGAGIGCVIGKSFARIFYRNAFNIGLPLLGCPEAVDGIRQGDEIYVDMASGRIENKTIGATYNAQPIPPFMRELIEAGGLMPYRMRQLI